MSVHTTSYSRSFLRELKYRKDIAEGKDYASLIEATVEEITEGVLRTARSGLAPWFSVKTAPALKFHSKERERMAIEDVMGRLRLIFPDCVVRYEEHVVNSCIHVEWM